MTRPDNKILREIAILRNGQPTSISEVFISPGAGPAIYVCFPVSQGRRVRGYVVGLYAVRELVSAIANGAALVVDRTSARFLLITSLQRRTAPTRPDTKTRTKTTRNMMNRRIFQLPLPVPNGCR